VSLWVDELSGVWCVAIAGDDSIVSDAEGDDFDASVEEVVIGVLTIGFSQSRRE